MPKGVREGGKSAAVLKAQRGAKKGTQKGRTRKFTSPEDLAAEAAQLELEREGGGAVRDPNEQEAAGDTGDSEESGSSESSEEEGEKTKGVESLIEISNPNRVVAKSKKISELTLDKITLDEATAAAPPQLSRREREEIDKEKQKKLHEQLRAEGKTEQARADLARLAIIRQEREQAAKRREADTKVKEAARAAKVESTPSLRKDDPGAPEVTKEKPAKK